MIEALLTKEFLSLLGGSLVGFIFRASAEKRALEQERFERTISLIEKTDESANKAAERVPHDVGKTVRRIIVLTVLFGSVIAPFILPFFAIQTIVEVPIIYESIFWGLFGNTQEKSFVPINGFLMSEELRQILVTIVGFYFGNASAARKT